MEMIVVDARTNDHRRDVFSCWVSLSPLTLTLNARSTRRHQRLVFISFLITRSLFYFCSHIRTKKTFCFHRFNAVWWIATEKMNSRFLNLFFAYMRARAHCVFALKSPYPFFFLFTYLVRFHFCFRYERVQFIHYNGEWLQYQMSMCA